jgi:Histidine kinase-, DNA gyrase B-, and HSP90-like ATPase
MKINAEDDTVHAYPAKRFFVEMLTRDIELPDAILDLLDNCLDGAVRTNSLKKKNDPKRPYEGYWVKITLDAKHFRIEDNCGGMPIDIARNYAFRFGRPDQERDTKLATVGVYGIGMKRALFKLGTDCKVLSNHADGSFGIHIDEAWIAGDDKWSLKMDRKAKVPKEYGVSIEVKDLHPQISYQFDPNKGNFSELIKTKVRDHYSYILKKGFNVSINGKQVEPSTIQTIISKADDLKHGSVIAPYAYKTEHDGVKVNLVMGMYERFPSEIELDEFTDGKRSKHTAGWTVVCNDRVVVSNDTTHVTGWGEAGVPVYHSQFVMLSGIVEFTSNDASKLPVTTTKRGVDLSSPLYAEVKDVMRDALKHFTSFTNRWKTQTEERAAMQATTKAIDIRDAAISIPTQQWQPVRKGLKGHRYVPELPTPKEGRTHARIVFTKPIAEINNVSQYLFEQDDHPKPAEVGEAAFDWVLEKAKR